MLYPLSLLKAEETPESNINERYMVEGIEFTGIDQSKLSRDLRDEAQKMVGQKYSEQSANNIARSIRREMRDYSVAVKVDKGAQPEQVKVVFEMKRRTVGSVSAVPYAVYHSKQGLSGSLNIPINISQSTLIFQMTNDADRLLERNAGWRFGYEHRSVGTKRLRFRMDFETYHQKFNPATESALALDPDVPGIYRSRQNFAPSLTFTPVKNLSLSGGVSFQRLQFQYPEINTQTAYAGTADVSYQIGFEPKPGYRQDVSASYGLRTATRILDSNLVYTRHAFSGSYSLSKGRNLFGASFLGGYINGTAPLFERFSFGNSTTLRGWNKFDVAPLGGTRAVHGSLEYRYRHYQLFYDVGTVWDAGMDSRIRHGLGFGWTSKHLFASLAFPLRMNRVAPVFILGIR